MSSTSAPPGQDRSVLRRVIWRVLFGLLLVAIFLLGLVYCTAHSGPGDDKGSAPALPTFTTSATGTPTSLPTTTRSAATTTPGSASTATGAKPRKALAGSKSGTGSKSDTSSTAGAGSKSGGSKPRSGTAPRSAPNTGGGSASGAVDLRLVTGGVLLVLASIALGSVTFRRWRRAW